jgi:O-glycosyl hydrolase
VRASDGAMTVMVINKDLSGNTPVTLNLAHFTQSGSAQVWRLISSNAIQHLSNISWAGGKLSDTAPPQSITLYVLPK